MKKLNPQDFVVPPEELEAMRKSGAKSPPPHKPKPQMFYQFPEVVANAILRTNYMPALAVAMAVYKSWFRDFKHRNPVKLTTALLMEFGISRDQKWRALKILERNGHFLVERSPRRNPLVMMKWKLPKD